MCEKVISIVFGVTLAKVRNGSAYGIRGNEFISTIGKK